MKKRRFLIIIILSLILLGFTVNSCKVDNDPKDYLQKVLNNLESINSAFYFSTAQYTDPGDTTPSIIYNRFYKTFSNPADTFVGASFIILMSEDTTKMDYLYNGKMRARVNWDEKNMEIDSFKHNTWPFRPVNAPFFIKAQYLIKYALESKDNISIKLNDLGDSIHFSLSINNDILEIIGNRIVHDTLFYSGKGEISKYEFWINKSNNLPYRLRIEMPHYTSVETYKKLILNKNKLEDFIASEYFPADCPLKTNEKEVKKVDLLNKVAPDWDLTDSENKHLALKDIKSKVLMLQFTSVNCGPCRASIPFLKKLSLQYKANDFDFVAIESFARNSNVLYKYQHKNDFNYKFLMSTDEVTRSYQIQAVPVFYILDKNRVIRKIIRGYGSETTDNEIIKAINELL